MRTQVDAALGDRAIASVERTLDQNATAVEFWSGYADVAAPTVPHEAADALRALREATLELLDRKAASPLEPVVADAAFTAAQAAVAGVEQAAGAYNLAVAAANAVIEAKKTTTGAADIRAVQAELLIGA